MRVTKVIPKPLPPLEWERFQKITIRMFDDLLLLKLPQHANGKAWEVRMELAIKQVPAPTEPSAEGAEVEQIRLAKEEK